MDSVGSLVSSTDWAPPSDPSDSADSASEAPSSGEVSPSELPEPEDSVPDGDGSRASVLPTAVARTGRNCICEDAEMASSCSSVGVPGMETTMLFSPWVVTSAPVVPWESMRWTMMSRAWDSCS